MDWNFMVTMNREKLVRILAGLVAMAGLTDGRTHLPRRIHRAVLRLLRPAEAAARRLIIVAARGLQVQVFMQQADRQPFARPARALVFTVRQPVVGKRAQPVVHVQRGHQHAAAPGGLQRGVQQGSGIAAPAVGDPDHRRLLHQRSLVSVKRP